MTIEKLDALKPGYYWIENTPAIGAPILRIIEVREGTYFYDLEWYRGKYFIHDKPFPLAIMLQWMNLKIESVKPPSF